MTAKFKRERPLPYDVIVGNPMMRNKRLINFIENNKTHGERIKSMLDIGCNQGMTLLTFLNNRKGRVLPSEFAGISGIGIDINPFNIQICQDVATKYQLPGQFLRADITTLEVSKTYDAVILFEVLEHFTEDVSKDLLFKARKMLNPNGLIFISTPDVNGMYGASNPDPHHFYLYEKNELLSYLNDQGYVHESAFDHDLIFAIWQPRPLAGNDGEKMALSYEEVEPEEQEVVKEEPEKPKEEEPQKEDTPKQNNKKPTDQKKEVDKKQK